MSELTLSENKLIDGDRYSTGHFWTGLAAGTIITLLIRNPTDSGKEVLLDPIRINNTSKIYVRKLKNPTVSADGTPVDTVNKNFGESDKCVVEPFHGATITDRGTEFNPEVFGGGQNNKVGGDAQVGSDLLFPDDSMIVEIEITATDTDISIDSNYVVINSE